jgi:hypothetical protein
MRSCSPFYRAASVWTNAAVKSSYTKHLPINREVRWEYKKDKALHSLSYKFATYCGGFVLERSLSAFNFKVSS